MSASSNAARIPLPGQKQRRAAEHSTDLIDLSPKETPERRRSHGLLLRTGTPIGILVLWQFV